MRPLLAIALLLPLSTTGCGYLRRCFARPTPPANAIVVGRSRDASEDESDTEVRPVAGELNPEDTGRDEIRTAIEERPQEEPGATPSKGAEGVRSGIPVGWSSNPPSREAGNDRPIPIPRTDVTSEPTDPEPSPMDDFGAF